MNGTHPWEEHNGEEGRPQQPDPTRPMPSPSPEPEEFSSSRHDPGYGRSEQYDVGHLGPQGWEPAPPPGNVHYPVPPQHPRQPGLGGPHHPQQGVPAPGPVQPVPGERPARERKRSGSCLGVLIALFMAVFAGVGTVLLLHVWMQASYAGSLWEVLEFYRTQPNLLQDGLTGLPVFIVAAVLCLVAAFFLPSRLGALRGLGVVLVLAANVAYAYGVALWIHPYYSAGGLLDAAVQRWQSLGELWPSVLVADVVLVPVFLLLTLLAVVASRPRRV